MEPMLTSEQVAEKLQVSVYTVHRLIKGGALNAVKVGRSYRVDADWLTDYLARQSENTHGLTERSRQYAQRA